MIRSIDRETAANEKICFILTDPNRRGMPSYGMWCGPGEALGLVRRQWRGRNS